MVNNLMVLDGERLSYRTLDVEQIGSVYESIMGFRAELTTGRSIAVRSPKRTGAAVVVDLDKLLATAAGQRVNALKAQTDRNLTGNAATMLRDASTPEEIVQALDRNVDREATPNILPANTPVLQPTDERRRTGSHYTPRSLTEPIVTEALRPVFDRLGASPTPEAILDLKVLDPATGSGAFLVEACRQLAEKLVDAWSAHGAPTDILPDEDQLLYAKRLVAQRCLYGVDKNSMAIDLARLSLWLATLSRDHEFTFVDHSLRHGDSLVGLTREQIEGFHWKAGEQVFQPGVEAIQMRERLAKVNKLRQEIRRLGDQASEQYLLALLNKVQSELCDIRAMGDLILTAFFNGTTNTARERDRRVYAELIAKKYDAHADIFETDAQLDVDTFHWGIEFPEVFDRNNPGFDAIVGNPPFAGKNTIAAANVAGYLIWLQEVHPESHGNSDLVAHFFRRAFNLIRVGGIIGLIATNTIGQGDTRSTGLRWICKNGGTIYCAKRRISWPGEAAVVVSVIHINKGTINNGKRLDGHAVDEITAFLVRNGGHDDPARLAVNAGKSFQGSIVLGMGFTFDDTDAKGVATPIAEMHELIDKDPSNRSVIFPYIGGEELNEHPRHEYHRWVIDFADRSESACRSNWPDLMQIVESQVKPQRDRQKRKALREKWWQYAEKRPGLVSAISGLDRVLVTNCQATPHHAFAFLPAGAVYANSLEVFPMDTYSAFCGLQARPHEIWAWFFSSSLEDRLRYNPSDCFDTFPFPDQWESNPNLGSIGEAYYQFRAGLMVRNNEGMTKTYNRFHDPDEHNPDILRLRELHAQMDRVMLDAYGWTDVPTDCQFLLDYEIDEEEYRRKKKPWRYRWPDEVHDDVLARLLALNGERTRLERIMTEQAAQAAKIDLLKA